MNTPPSATNRYAIDRVSLINQGYHTFRCKIERSGYE